MSQLLRSSIKLNNYTDYDILEYSNNDYDPIFRVIITIMRLLFILFLIVCATWRRPAHIARRP